ncbi:MAG: tRNA-dihydrouridine synthase family protein [Candidatus Woesearchaeota archaeon]
MLYLAPMAGINCPAFRRLCRYYGADATYTQMLDADKVAEDPDFYDRYLDIHPDERPVIIQLIGSKETLKTASEKVSPFADGIDINMGCIEKPMLGKQAGCFLMKHPEQIKKAISYINTDKPISAKIRAGWDTNNALEVAKILEELGIRTIALHPRTKLQGYKGKADWNITQQLVQKTDCTIIGNGDITEKNATQKITPHLMIGRGAIGNPIIFQRIKKNSQAPISIKEKKEQFSRFLSFYKEQKRKSYSEIRQHACWFFKNIPRSREIRQKILDTKDQRELESCIRKI